MNKIKELRLKKKLTQKQLAQMVGVSDAAINKYENGSMSPKTKNVIKLAKALDTDPGHLMASSPEQEQFYSSMYRTDETFNNFREQRYIDAFESLNDAGEKELFRYAKFLSELTEFKAPDPLPIKINGKTIHLDDQ